MPKDELANHNCIKHLRSVVQQQQSKIAELEKTAAEHKHQLAEQVRVAQTHPSYPETPAYTPVSHGHA